MTFQRLLALWFGSALWKRVLLGLFLGSLWGMVFQEESKVLEPIGDLFLRSIKMIVAPLVLSTIVTGIVSMGDLGKLSSMGAKIVVFYLCTTAIAILIGIAAASLLPSLPLTDEALQAENPIILEGQSFVERIVSVIPTNPFAALAEGNVFQILFFSILLGTGILMCGEKGQSIASAISSFADAMLKVTMIVMELAPIGVFALIAVTIGSYGTEAIGSLISLIVVFYAACIFHVIIIYGGLVRYFLQLNPRCFYYGILDAQIVAFSTTSSSATLPASLKCAQENLGVGSSTASFVLPLGATVNMDGTGIYLGITTVFAAQLAGITLSITDCAELVVVATITSIGIAGVPGGSLIMLSTVLATLELPLEVFALVAGIDRILDMARTTVNVSGDLVGSVYVGKKMNDFDLSVYEASPTA